MINESLLKINETINEEFKEDDEYFERLKKFLLENLTINEEETIKYQNFLLLLLDPNLKEKNLILKILQSKNSDFWISIIQFLSPELQLFSKYKQVYFPILEDLKLKKTEFKKILLKNFNQKIQGDILKYYEILLSHNLNHKVSKRIQQIEKLIFNYHDQEKQDFDYLCELYEIFEFNLLDILEYNNIEFSLNFQIFVLQKNLKEIFEIEMEKKIDFINTELLMILNWFLKRLKSKIVKYQWKILIIEILLNFMKRINFNFNNLYEIFLNFFEKLLHN